MYHPELVKQNFLGGKFFQFPVSYVLNLNSIVNALLWATILENSPVFLSWNKEKVIELIEVWITSEGINADREASYPEARAIYGKLAKQKAEELFPELIYDEKAYNEKLQSFFWE